MLIIDKRGPLMDVKLENVTGRPLWIRLLNGDSVDMSPAVPPIVVSEREARVNPRIRKLLERGAIREVEKIRRPPGAKQAAPEPKSAPRASAKAEKAE